MSQNNENCHIKDNKERKIKERKRLIMAVSKNHQIQTTESEITSLPDIGTDTIMDTVVSGKYIGIAKGQDQINVIFDYTDTAPVYMVGDAWWNFDEANNVIHILVNDKLKDRYVDLKNRNWLTNEEKSELSSYETLLNTLPHIAADRFLAQRSEFVEGSSQNTDITKSKKNGESEKKEYRTKKKAGEITDVPSKMPLITNPTWQNAITYNDDDKAYLQPLTSADGLVFENGILYFEGMPATSARLSHLYTKDNIEDFNLPMLRVFYAIILNKFQKTWKEDKTVDDVVKFYIPDLAKQLGKNYKISQSDTSSIINTILSFQNIMGIINRGKRGNDILPVLVFLGNDTEANTIKFASPYMVRVIQDVYKASIRKSKIKLDIPNKNSAPKLLPSHTYIPNLKLGKERNQKAVEIVCIVMTTIEQAGSRGTAHISARTIVERDPLLKQSIDNTSSASNKNKYLERAFSRAWELLRTHTDILKKYKNIQLPDPKAKDFKAKYIPTMGTLDMVFEFPHEGKIKN